MNKQRITIKQGVLEIKLLVFFIKENDYYIAYSPALDLSSYAMDKEGAKNAFSEALHIFFEETKKKGTLEKLLLEQGWTLQPNFFQPPSTKASILNKLHDMVLFKETYNNVYA
jgi:hypothetical protein